MTVNKRDLQTGIKRLTKLVETLKAEKKIKFNLESWGRTSEYRTSTRESNKAQLEKVKNGICGTAACAAGTAGLIPEFRRAGFKLKFEKLGDNSVFTDTLATVEFTDSYGNAVLGFSACAKFFKIDYNTASHLFDPMSYGRTSKYYVVRRIESYINKMNKEISTL